MHATGPPQAASAISEQKEPAEASDSGRVRRPAAGKAESGFKAHSACLPRTQSLRAPEGGVHRSHCRCRLLLPPRADRHARVGRCVGGVESVGFGGSKERFDLVELGGNLPRGIDGVRQR